MVFRRFHEGFRDTLPFIGDASGVPQRAPNSEEPSHISDRTSTGHFPSPPDWGDSSDSVAGAGWGGTPELSALMPPALQVEPAFSWLRLKSLTGGRRNDPCQTAPREGPSLDHPTAGGAGLATRNAQNPGCALGNLLDVRRS
jgi:hypothetical protein